MLCVSERKMDRIKKKFVQEGLDLTLNRQPWQCEYDLKIDGHLEAQLLAMSSAHSFPKAKPAGRCGYWPIGWSIWS